MEAATPELDENASQQVPAFYKRRRKRGDELGQVLLRSGVITPEQLRDALKLQADEGGHLGATLRRMGACDARAIAEALLEQVRVTRGKGNRARDLAVRARETPSIMGLVIECRPRLTKFLVVASDALALSLGTGLAWLVVAQDAPGRVQRYGILAVLPLCLLAFMAIQLYAATPPSPPEEIRRTTLGVTFVCAGLWLVAFLVRSGGLDGVQHLAWLTTWFVGVLLVPISRASLRWKFAARRWWGQPVVVLGAGRVGRAVVGTLQRRPQLGLKPVAVLDDDARKHGTLRVAWGDSDIEVETVPESSGEPPKSTPDSSSRQAWGNFSQVEEVPVLGGLELAPMLAQRLNIRFAVVAMPEADSAALLGIIERYAEPFQSVLAIPDLFDLAYFGAATRDLGGVLGIEVRRQLLLTGPRFAKRLMDVAFTFVGLLLISPVLLLIMLLIKLDSRGPVFYQQKRLGQDGVRFPAFKFRSMHGDGEERLEKVLSQDPRLRAEYEEFHKLTVDPRVTRFGRVLRKFSLDELPQLWNVFVGDMSLVGPRPYLEREIPEMDQKEAIILRVKPGITGIWQVTERNASSFERRLHMDVEYVRSWSPWLDIYVLAKTVPVVVGGTGS